MPNTDHKTTLRESENNNPIEVMRATACFLVILLHTSAAVFYEFPTRGWHIATLYDSIARPCVPLFLMISGYLMLNNVSPIQSFYRKRFSKILVPTLFFSILYYFAHFIIKKGPGPSEFLPNLLKGPVIYHLWYMYLLLGIYLVIPFFQRLYASSSESDLKILIGIWFVFGILLPNIKEVTGLDISANGYAEASEFFSYLGYVLWGGFMKKHAINVSMIKTKILASLALVFVSTVAITHWKQKADEAFFVYNSVFVFFYSTYLFHWISKTPVRSLPNIVLLLNNSSFGIYLVHVFYLVLFNNIGFTGNFIHPSLGIPICASAIFTISFLTIHIARKVPILRAVTG